MKTQDACRILGIASGDGKEEIKKKYRTLIHKVHPDAQGMDRVSDKQAKEISLSFGKTIYGYGKMSGISVKGEEGR